MKKYTKTLLPVRRQGWTFIELLVTIVILAIATLFVGPQASSGASASGQSATRLAVTEILAAQMDAVALQEFRRIEFFADGSGWCVEVLQSNQLNTPYNAATAEYADDVYESQGHNQKSVIDFNQDTRFTNVSISSPLFDGANTSIIFDQTGGVIAPDGSPSTGGSFEVKSGDHAWQVLLAPLTGKVTVSKVGSP
jgi:prepilin-type N-terminal cleavage/methylation domain-containing protein